ncbi:hypothetical protein KEM54_004525 [Ascosphaera aggregata]|nr:hypothetical protein KEM54_004525 [Ascosphaera aggregata]
MLIENSFISNYTVPDPGYQRIVDGLMGRVNNLARILSLEGGYCKKSRLIPHFDNDHDSSESGNATQEGFSPLPQIHTLVLRGAWNIMRSYEHWQTITSALPNLHETQITYAKPRPAGHATVARILSHLQPSIKNLDLCLEDFHCDWGYFRGVQFYSLGQFTRRSAGVGSLIRQFNGTPVPFDGHFVTLPDGNMIYRHQHVTPGTLPHLCRFIGAVVTRLEAMSLTGRCCHKIFQIAADLLRQSKGEGQLRALDLAVKGCCSQSERSRKPRGSEPQPSPHQAHFVDNVAPVMGNHNGIVHVSHPASAMLDLNDPAPSAEQILYPVNGSIFEHSHSETHTPPHFIPYDHNDLDMDVEGPTDHELDSELDVVDSDEDQPALSSDAYNGAYVLPNTNFLRFIKSFEQLVLSILSALDVFPHLESIRIRFIELDSALGLTNPYFEVNNGLVQGVWSDRILHALDKRRPQWRYVELNEGVPQVRLGSGAVVREGDSDPGRPKSIKIEAYEAIAKDLRRQFHLEDRF